jgi:hypothetical protein
LDAVVSDGDDVDHVTRDTSRPGVSTYDNDDDDDDADDDDGTDDRSAK